MSFLIANPRIQPLNDDGEIMPGCYFQFYVTQTTTPTPVYADGELTTPLSNPVVSDAAGRFPAMYGDSSVVYRVRLYTAANVLMQDDDPVHPLSSVPPGTVLTFFGTAGARDAAYPPALFGVCDGTNGTPDMRDRFPIGVSATKTIGTTGGAVTAVTDSGGAVGAGVTGSTTLSSVNMPVHNHRMYVRTSSTLRGNTRGFGFANTAGVEGQDVADAPYGYLDVAPSSGGNKLIEETGSGSPTGHTHTTPAVAAHTHTLSGGGLPPYLALWFLMRLP